MESAGIPLAYSIYVRTIYHRWAAGTIMVPKKMPQPHPIPGTVNTLRGKADFADVVKLPVQCRKETVLDFLGESSATA